MLNLKTLSTGIAAAAVVGTIGLAYAQSTPETVPATPTSPAQTTATDNSTTVTPGATNPGMGTTGNTTGNMTPADTQLEPRADRN